MQTVSQAGCYKRYEYAGFQTLANSQRLPSPLRFYHKSIFSSCYTQSQCIHQASMNLSHGSSSSRSDAAGALVDGEARSAAELEDGEARSAAELEDGAGVAQGGGEGITAAAAAAATPGTAASPIAVRLARKVAYEYNIGSALSVLFSYKGTFWLSCCASTSSTFTRCSTLALC